MSEQPIRNEHNIPVVTQIPVSMVTQQLPQAGGTPIMQSPVRYAGPPPPINQSAAVQLFRQVSPPAATQGPVVMPTAVQWHQIAPPTNGGFPTVPPPQLPIQPVLLLKQGEQFLQVRRNIFNLFISCKYSIKLNEFF